MDLFSDTKATQSLRERLEPYLGDWVLKLNSLQIQQLQITLQLVNVDSRSNTVYPKKNEVFRIFKNCKLEDIRVVILGQDCYHNGNANGYAFGCAQTMSPSLHQIVDSIKKTLPKTDIKKDIGLQYLVDQGVFLLNTILTVRAGSPLSHDNLGWQSFTIDIVKLIQTRNDIVWLLWGSKAKEYTKIITNPTHFIIEDTHPASASHNNRDWNSKCFVECNNILREKNLKEIVWL